MKEIISCIVIILSIYLISVSVEKYLEKTGTDLTNNLEHLKDQIMMVKNRDDEEKVSAYCNEILNKWDEINQTWSMIITHAELDSIMISMLKLKSAIEVRSYDDALEEIDVTIFLVGHIKDKETLVLKNIF